METFSYVDCLWLCGLFLVLILTKSTIKDNKEIKVKKNVKKL